MSGGSSRGRLSGVPQTSRARVPRLAGRPLGSSKWKKRGGEKPPMRRRKDTAEDLDLWATGRA